MSNNFTILLPAIVGILYFGTGIAWCFKKDWAWALVWFGYALAQIGLIIVGGRK